VAWPSRRQLSPNLPPQLARLGHEVRLCVAAQGEPDARASGKEGPSVKTMQYLAEFKSTADRDMVMLRTIPSKSSVLHRNASALSRYLVGGKRF